MFPSSNGPSINVFFLAMAGSRSPPLLSLCFTITPQLFRWNDPLRTQLSESILLYHEGETSLRGLITDYYTIITAEL